LPSYARPQGELMDRSSIDGGDLIEYRTLTRADFQGEKPAGDAAEHVDAMGAQTYAIVRPDPNLKLVITAPNEPSADARYFGKLESPLHFRAQMDRKRSWWNPNLKNVPEDYVLKHEQIHFALAALEAQHLNASSAELTQSMRVEGHSEEEVRDAIRGKLEGIIRQALERLIDQNGKFDEDTSARYDPKKQDAWWRRLSGELAHEGR
jgi:hypothetical protein